MNKPREFWIDNSAPYEDSIFDKYDESCCRDHIHVIEYSAVDKLQKENELLGTYISKLTEENERLQKDWERLNIKCGAYSLENERISAEVEGLKAERDSFEYDKKNAELSAEVETWKKRAEDKGEQWAKAADEIDKLTAEVQRLKADISVYLNKLTERTKAWDIAEAKIEDLLTAGRGLREGLLKAANNPHFVISIATDYLKEHGPTFGED